MSRKCGHLFRKCAFWRFGTSSACPKSNPGQHARRYLSMQGNAEPRFFAMMQQARSKLLDHQKQSAIVSHREKVNGVDLHFETTGDGRHVVLLLPGAMGSTRTDFEKQLTDFNKTDYTLVAMDPQGYGRSIPPERTWPLEFLQRDADDAHQLCKSLGVHRVSVVGWSDGGITGLILAAKDPSLVSKLVIWGANAYVTQQDNTTFEGLRDIEAWSDRMRVPFLELYGEEYFRKHWSRWVDAYSAYYTDRKGDICMNDLQKITADTLIIHGVKDALVPQEHPDYLHANIKGSQLHIMPEGKHNLHIRYFQEFNSMVEQFLQK